MCCWGRAMFHQHFTSSFVVQIFFAAFLCLPRCFAFFDRKLWKKLHEKYWWNWLQVFYQKYAFSKDHKFLGVNIVANDNVFSIFITFDEFWLRLFHNLVKTFFEITVKYSRQLSWVATCYFSSTDSNALYFWTNYWILLFHKLQLEA